MVARDWLRSLYFFIQSKAAREILLLPCRIAVWKYVFISCTLFCSMSGKKNYFKMNFLNKQSKKHKASRSIAKYLRQRVLVGSVWKIFKNRKIIRTHGETGTNEPQWIDTPSDGVRRQVCRIVQCDGFSLN